MPLFSIRAARLRFTALAFPVLLLPHVACRAQTQDPTAIVQQLTQLMQQIQQGDPCPYMGQFKSLMGQLAQQSPDIYNAMKPSIDLINQENGCSPATPPTTNAIQDATDQQIAAIRAKQAQAAQAQAQAAQVAAQQLAAQQAAQAQAASQTAAQQKAQAPSKQNSTNSASHAPDHNCIGGEKNYTPGKGCLVAGR